MNEIDETIKELDRIGDRGTFVTLPTKSWWIQISADNTDRIKVIYIEGRFGFSNGGYLDCKRKGFKMIEALADRFPFIAKKLAKPW